MNPKKLNPYQYLLAEIRQYCCEISNLPIVEMWHYPKDKLNRAGGWSLDDLWERTVAANQLGYEVILVAQDDGLHVHYRKKPPEVPYSWR